MKDPKLGGSTAAPPPPPPPGGHRPDQDTAVPGEAKPTVGELAMRGAQALKAMTPATRDQLVDSIPGQLGDVLNLVIGGALENKLLDVKRDKLLQRIERGTTPVYTATAQSGQRVGDLRELLGEHFVRAPEVARTLAAMVKAAGTSVEDLERLVARLEVLRDIGEKRDLAMVSNRELKARVLTFTNGDLGALLGDVARELAVLAYEPLRKTARAEKLI